MMPINLAMQHAILSPTARLARTMEAILESEFHHDGRGPELQRVVWSSATPLGFEYYNPEDVYVVENLRHLRLVRVVAFAYAGEEVHGNIVTSAGTHAAIHDLGRSPWLRSFSPRHLDGCSHYQVMFYDEVFDVICHAIRAGSGPYDDEGLTDKPVQPDEMSPRR